MAQTILAGYAVDRSLPLITQDAAQKLTHINVAFGHVVDAEIRTDHLKNMGHLEQIRSWNPNLRIILSIGGWGAGGFSEAASTAEGRASFAKTSVEALKRYDLDGIDLDWEYPCYSQAGIASSREDKRNFTLLLQEVRSELDKQGELDGRHYILSIATGADQYYTDGTEMEEVHKVLDFVQLMTYDMRGGFQTLTGHHTNLYTPTGDLFRISVDASVQLFVNAGVPREKIVIGAAFYSRMWKDVPNQNNGYLQMTPAAGGYGPTYAELAEKYIGKSEFVRHWDDEAKAPYLFDGSRFITYDDEESLQHKCDYVRDSGLAGIMFWEYGCDPSLTLLNALHRGFARNR